jgi:apolipoprotein N-acyltransferase
VENRVFLARAANTGVSGFIAPSGKIISLVQDETGKEIFIDGYKTQSIAIPKRGASFYTRYGDIFIFLLFIFVIYSIFRVRL